MLVSWKVNKSFKLFNLQHSDVVVSHVISVLIVYQLFSNLLVLGLTFDIAGVICILLKRKLCNVYDQQQRYAVGVTTFIRQSI